MKEWYFVKIMRVYISHFQDLFIIVNRPPRKILHFINNIPNIEMIYYYQRSDIMDVIFRFSQYYIP